MVDFTNPKDVGRLLAIRERSLEYQKTNREKSLEPRHSKHWCGYCDRALVSAGGKCPVCHSRIFPRRFKK